MNNESKGFEVLDPGHSYKLFPHISGTGEADSQTLNFIKKEPKEEGSTELVTVQEGTTNEAVIAVLIDRLESLHVRLPDTYTLDAISHLKSALSVLEKRAIDRKERGVLGTRAA